MVMTETSPVSVQSSVNDSIDKRVSTVGHVHPHVEIKIVDLEGQIVPQGLWVSYASVVIQ